MQVLRVISPGLLALTPPVALHPRVVLLVGPCAVTAGGKPRLLGLSTSLAVVLLDGGARYSSRVLRNTCNVVKGFH